MQTHKSHDNRVLRTEEHADERYTDGWSDDSFDKPDDELETETEAKTDVSAE